MVERLTIALVGGGSQIRRQVRALLDPDHKLVDAEVNAARAPGCACIVVIDEPAGTLEALLADPPQSAERPPHRLPQHVPLVAVVAGRAARRAALRAGATAVLEREALNHENLQRALEDALDRHAGLARRADLPPPAGRAEDEDEQLHAQLIDLRQRLEDAQRVRQLADSLPAYIAYIDSQQRYLFLNQTYAKHFRRRPDELRGRTVLEVLGPENYQSVQPALEAALAGQQLRTEHRLRVPSGADLHVDSVYVPDRRADGTIAGCFVMVVDVSERRRAEDLTRRVLANLYAFVGLLALDGTLIETNQAPLTAAGIRFEDVRGQKFWDCYWFSHCPELQARVREACERAAAGEIVREDVPVRVIDNGRMIIDLQIAPLRDEQGSVIYLVPSGVDVTHRVRVEQILRESEGRLLMAQEAAGIGIHDYDLRSGRICWDQRVRAIWGIAPDEELSPALFEAGVHPDDRPTVEAAYARARKGDCGQIMQIEHRIIRRSDGQVRWVAATARTLVEGDEPVRLVGTMQDITARKQGEQALRRSQEQLRESDRRKDEFLAMLGHELRNPLAAICSAAELLHVYAASDARLAPIRDALERQANHMTRLIDGLLEVSRIARGKLHLECKLVNLDEVLEGVLHDRRNQAARAGLTLSYELTDAPLWVWGDEVRLAQIFDNLLGNAIKFTAESGVGVIRVLARRSGDSAVVTVSDTGIGICPDMLESIFEPFRQGTPELTRSKDGLGLGLALVRGLVELHHGRVLARSRGRGQGAEFEVTLPLSGPGLPKRA